MKFIIQKFITPYVQIDGIKCLDNLYIDISQLQLRKRSSQYFPVSCIPPTIAACKFTLDRPQCITIQDGVAIDE